MKQGLCFCLYMVLMNAIKSKGSNECGTIESQLILNSSASRQLLLTPGFIKGRYLPNMDCHWIIKASSTHHRIQLTITNSQIEDRIFTNCDDFLEVRDGDVSTAQRLALWCGHRHPFSIISSSNALYIRFKSDKAYELRGANMSFVDFAVPGCPPDWVTEGENCYHYVPEHKVIWVEAQRQCMYDRSNLATFQADREYSSLFVDLFASRNGATWIGYSDAQSENDFKSVNPVENIWPDPFPKFTQQDLDNKDCVFVSDQKDSNDNIYGVADCRSQKSYMCKRRKDGSTAPYPPPEAAVKQGLKPIETAWTPLLLWPLYLVLFILLLLILVPICYTKKKHKSRVDASTAGSNVGLLPQPTPAPLYAKIEPKNDRNAGDLTVRSVSRIVEQTYGTDEIEVTDQRKMVENSNLVITPVTLHDKTVRAANGSVPQLDNHHGTTKMALPPLDRFDRPYVRMLDNVSAISLDEFWHKMDGNKYKSTKNVPPPTAETGRTML